MHTILCYGDSNTWGYVPSKETRFERWERWTGVAQRQLGDDVYLVEEGLNGRRSAFDSPFEPHRNGLSYLPVSLETHAPIDVVVVFLGTNDLFLPGHVTAHFAALGVGALVDLIRTSAAGPAGAPPQVLVLVPPPFGPLGQWEADSPHGQAESERFSETFREMAAERDCRTLDLRGVASSSPLDGVHLEAADHGRIGLAVAAALGEMLGFD